MQYTSISCRAVYGLWYMANILILAPQNADYIKDLPFIQLSCLFPSSKKVSSRKRCLFQTQFPGRTKITEKNKCLTKNVFRRNYFCEFFPSRSFFLSVRALIITNRKLAVLLWKPLFLHRKNIHVLFGPRSFTPTFCILFVAFYPNKQE